MDLSALEPYANNEQWNKSTAILGSWLDASEPEDLFRVNVLQLSTQLGIESGLLTDIFLASVIEGLFDLRWDYHCPHCNGIPHSFNHLHAAKGSASCPQCTIEYRNELDRTVEVCFTASESFGALTQEIKEKLLDEYHQSLVTSDSLSNAPRLTGLDLLHRPFFHQHFSDDVLNAEESLEIRSVVFLFTDIKGSTQLYEQLGDASAYSLVKEHFAILFDAIQRNGGVVIKTIGDAVMASFRKASEAFEAALAVHERISQIKIPGTEESVIVKMGLHAGPAIAVTMNNRFDYFGQTVNKAARIQGLAKQQEIFLSEALVEDVQVRKTLIQRKDRVSRWRTKLKGLDGKHLVYSIS